MMSFASFLDYFEKNFKLAAPLMNWRETFKRYLNFDAFKENYLISTQRVSDKVICTSYCNGHCPRKIIRETDGRIKAVCPRYINKYFYVNDENELVIYRLKIKVLHQSIVNALGCRLKFGMFSADNLIWRLGDFLHNSTESIPVFLSFNKNETQLGEVVKEITFTHDGRFLLLTVIRSDLDFETEKSLNKRGGMLLALNEIMEFDYQGQLQSSSSTECLFSDCHQENKMASQVPVQEVFEFTHRRIHKGTDDESEQWYVDGKLKKVYTRKKMQSMQVKILNILYDQIGNGWIPHKSFINITGWTEDKYLGAEDSKPGYMQQQLRHIRRHLGVRILFDREYGVKFAEDIVK